MVEYVALAKPKQIINVLCYQETLLNMSAILKMLNVHIKLLPLIEQGSLSGTTKANIANDTCEIP